MIKHANLGRMFDMPFSVVKLETLWMHGIIETAL